MTIRNLALALLALLPLIAGRGEAHAAVPQRASRQTVHIDGPAVCNCSDSAVERPLCHVSYLVVGVGGDRVWVDTGLGNACVNTAVPAGRCVYYRYTLSCFEHGIAGWSCYVESAGIACGDVTPASGC